VTCCAFALVVPEVGYRSGPLRAPPCPGASWGYREPSTMLRRVASRVSSVVRRSRQQIHGARVRGSTPRTHRPARPVPATRRVAAPGQDGAAPPCDCAGGVPGAAQPPGREPAAPRQAEPRAGVARLLGGTPAGDNCCLRRVGPAGRRAAGAMWLLRVGLLRLGRQRECPAARPAWWRRSAGRRWPRANRRPPGGNPPRATKITRASTVPCRGQQRLGQIHVAGELLLRVPEGPAHRQRGEPDEYPAPGSGHVPPAKPGRGRSAQAA